MKPFCSPMASVHTTLTSNLPPDKSSAEAFIQLLTKVQPSCSKLLRASSFSDLTSLAPDKCSAEHSPYFIHLRHTTDSFAETERTPSPKGKTWHKIR